MFKEYNRDWFRSDVSAGLTVAVLVVPQSMAYAMLAGLPPVVGLYSSVVPLLVYAFFGSSRQLSIGPVAILSLLIFVGCSRLAPPGSPEYLDWVILLTLMTGAAQVILGILRMGFLTNFVSQAVLSGFISAAAVIIIVTQAGCVLGLQTICDGSRNVPGMALSSVQRMGDVHWLTLTFGLIALIALIGVQKLFPKIPMPLVCAVAGTLAAYFFQLEQKGLAVVGEVPLGLPLFTIPIVTCQKLNMLIPTATSIVITGYMVSIAMSKTLASRGKYKVNANREFLGLGLANVIGAFLSSCPVSASPARTMVNHQAGARTQVASVVTAMAVVLTLVLLAPLLYHMPVAVLAAMIITAAVKMIDVRELLYLMKVDRLDCLILLVTFSMTLVLSAEKGILGGVVLSLLLFLWRSAHPKIAELGYLEQVDAYMSIQRFPAAKTIPKILMLRVDGPLFFANAGFVEDWVRDRIADHPDVKYVLFDLSSVNNMDAVGIKVLWELMLSYDTRGIDFAFAEMRGSVRDLFKRAGWRDSTGKDFGYRTIPQVLKRIESRETQIKRTDQTKRQFN
ncbi:sulfate permease [bacterium]|nr:sulfate permease [candidate division CSSED10-310 bacterium]